MKPRAIVFTALLLMAAAGGARAQEGAGSEKSHGFFAELVKYRTLDLDRVEKNFVGALDCPVDGAVEAAIAQIARVKLAQPGRESDHLREKIVYLVGHGRTTAIRFKAYLASMVFENPEMFAAEGQWEYAGADQFFRALANRLEDRALAAN